MLRENILNYYENFRPSISKGKKQKQSREAILPDFENGTSLKMI